MSHRSFMACIQHPSGAQAKHCRHWPKNNTGARAEAGIAESTMGKAWHEQTGVELGSGIGAGTIDPVELAEYFLERIAAEDADQRIFIRMAPERTRAEASAARARQKDGLRRGPLDGVPVSWKDLVDVAGVETTMATRALKGRVPERDALLLSRATHAGTVFLGKTNMTEFAFSGLGINTTHGTPANACDPDTPRIPGGSSSGAGVAVARGLGPIAIGSDTGGSVRIPAALNGIVGLKTTIGALSTQGVLPLSPLLDTVGPLTADTADAAAMWSVLSGRPMADLKSCDLKGRLFVAVDAPLWKGVDAGIDRACREGIAKLEAAGAAVEWRDVPELSEAMEAMISMGGLVTTDAWSCWSDLIEADPDLIYPPMLPRFQSGTKQAGHDLLRLMRRLDELSASLHRKMAGCDAMIAPTVPATPPAIADLIDDLDAYTKANVMSLRNTTPGNLTKVCALTLPCGVDDHGMPAGLMLMQRANQEEALLRVGKAVEAALG
jgi:aspartyl-tRNA(Asn)/glutamyl-tRNA(Gln) amidotransferase subunit A